MSSRERNAAGIGALADPVRRELYRFVAAQPVPAAPRSATGGLPAIAVSLPPREYELAGRLMADAIIEAADTGRPAVEVLNELAHDYGREVGEAAAEDGRPDDARAALALAAGVLGEHGYQPRRCDDEVYLTNCPFHALAQAQTQLACTMNYALITGVAETLAPYCPHARLCPDPSRCCVVLSLDGEPEPASPSPPTAVRHPRTTAR